MAAIAGLCMLLAVLVPQVQASSDLEQAALRWRQQGLASYRIAVMMDYRGELCYQELEVRGTQEPALVRGTCPLSWLGYLTVPRLFDLTDELSRMPDARCYPSSRNCICRRSFSVRQFGFDERLGYPVELHTYSELHPSWDRPELWLELLHTLDLRQCNPSPRRLMIQIVSLTPLSPARQ